MIIDDSLSIMNRTGAYYIARDIVEALSPQFAVRRWRIGSHLPEGLSRKVLARLMMAEIGALGDSPRFQLRSRGKRVLFLDPLYVLRAELAPGDLVLCHDPGPISHSWLYPPEVCEIYRKAYARIVQVRPAMAFVSHWSRREFVKLFGENFPRLDVIPLYRRNGILDVPAHRPPAAPDRFFLTVGALEVRKNQVAALEAYAQGGFHERGVGYVLCGSRGDAAREIADKVAATPGAHLIGYVSDSELRWLYENAEAFVLPSRLEGFGMPALEAASFGLLPIVSQDSALVEAVSGVCLEIDPEDPSDIARVMAEALARTAQQRDETARQLRNSSAQYTRERFLLAWRALASTIVGCPVS
ncbi:glycosyltransferase [Novosphingobium sp. KCTC 2891]|uniref:glycosyltransferase n=1 Tax=Novosphingobium sp. KCTC 2891 TaxID=2989730 RepID=UPI002222C181|nr:glycosyltransferase [Novosphingobium sp. KCTC 2891]MCW1382855.1 glycosyltransferase [Novosphingobium sp. KCTC 2891]